MGKQDRARRKRRGQDDDPLARALAPFTSRSLMALIEAAAVSPTAAHRSFSLAQLFEAVARRKQYGARTAGAADLGELLQTVPAMPSIEDFSPYDSREEVLIRWGDGLFRIVSGSLERPTTRVNQQALLAASIDPVLVPLLGFGLADVGELVLRRVDSVARALASRWPTGAVASLDDPASVTQAEVDAIAEVESFEDLAEKCSTPERAASAAAHYTVAARDLAPSSAYANSTFGTSIATRVRGRTSPLPAAYLVEALPAIGADLAAVAFAAEPRVERAFRRSIETRVARRFQGIGQPITGPLKIGSNGHLHSLVLFNGRQVVALNVVAGFDPSAVEAALSRGEEALKRVTAGATFTTSDGPHVIPADAQIVRAHVIVWLNPIMVSGEYPVLTLGDLEWILYTARQTPDDLWYFLRDLSRDDGVGSTFAWDMIDRWEVWRPEKSFYRGGAQLDHMMFAAHQAEAEWEEAGTTASIERALHSLGLRPQRDWPIVVPDHRRGAEVGDLATDEVWQVIPTAVPVGVTKTDPEAPHARNSELWHLAVSVAWKLQRCEQVFQQVARQSDLSSLRIVFKFLDRSEGPVLTSEQVGGGSITIGWDARLQPSLAEDSFAVESLVGQVLSEALVPDIRSEFISAWEASPPGIRVDGFRVDQRVQRLPDALEAHDAVRADMLGQLGKFLVAGDATPGVLEGPDATRFESETVFPWLVARFHESIARLSADALLEFALGQIERANHERFMLNKRLGWELGFPTGGEGNRSDEVNGLVTQTRTIAFVIEEVIAHPPSGELEVHDSVWIEIFSIASLCFDSCMRSAEIHNRLTRTATEITDLFEVRTMHSEEPTDVDVVRYQKLRAQHTLPEPVPIATGQGVDAGDNHQPLPIADRAPRLVPIDAAMRGALGFGIDAALGLLAVATQWEATAENPATKVDPDSIVDACVEAVIGADREEFGQALNWLTLRRQDLVGETIPHWETERRAKRIATSPFVEFGDEVWVLPWTAEATLKIFLNYLSDGRLPRPDTALPKPLNKALNQFRQKLNREAEKECTASLDVPGLVVRPTVKPEKAAHYGIGHLSGEIDTLCADPARSRIWVIEVKDSYTPYSPYQVRQLINRFNNPEMYVDTLLAKVADIESSAASLATKLGVDDPSRKWTVVGLLVTRHIEPAALVVEPKVAYCVLDDVLEVVTQDEIPALGLNGAAARLNAQE